MIKPSVLNGVINDGIAKFANNFHLKYLADENLWTNQDGVDICPDLASSCYGLEKLSVRVYPWDFSKASKIFKCIRQNSKSLKVLHINGSDDGHTAHELRSPCTAPW